MSDALGLSMGAVVRATGIPANTLRTWERRYGFPCPERTDGGHRIYSPEVVPRLRLVAQALDSGHRAAQVVPATLEDLRTLLGIASQPPEPAPEGAGDMLDAVRAVDGSTLQSALRGGVAVHGLLRFLQDRLAPFLQDVGERWADGELSVYQEHFASDHVRTFLGKSWRDLGVASDAPNAVLATLADERHDLGLQMAACVLALGGWRVTYLGADTPVGEVVEAVQSTGATAVMIGVSMASDPDETDHQLRELRASLPADVTLVYGGSGAPADVPGATRMTDLDALSAWANLR